ncbi:MAG TPA: Ppx/GppA phosphatase family protein [Caulobacteraceae bacterium]|jgi:exopolyphosphatase/guanosine-5'-triphosphate,3'-diphosphate pyrophosphatase|nr:Ppx/GppA phosphatase family protein [Caulobacteraceae bacterium]
MSDSESRPSSSDAAVIDVGSNSVRLVLYRVDGRAIWSVFNEKVLAGLGRDLSRTGALSPEGSATAVLALRRFKALIDDSRPTRVFTAATAAVRDASDGPEFRRRVLEQTGLDLRVLTGEEEARYAALGVAAGAPGCEGLVGDLGGASLELVRLDGKRAGRGVTLPLGPFAIAVGGRHDPDRARALTLKAIAPHEKLLRANTLTVVGGAWRNLALLQMRIGGYPLEIVHQYGVSRAELLPTVRFIARQSRGSLERIPGISRRRLENLPHAAAVLEALIDRLDIQRVSFSAFGVREGMLFESLPAGARQQDPLLAGCAALGGRPATAEALGEALAAWIEPAFENLDPVFRGRDRVLAGAVCRLADLGAQLHPDHRADLVFQQVLRAPIAGMNHSERAFVALAAFARHTASGTPPEPAVLDRLLNDERRQRARALGAAVRLACELSGRSPELLAHSSLEIRNGVVAVEADETWAPILLGEQTAKRAATLAQLLGREPRLRSRNRASLTLTG